MKAEPTATMEAPTTTTPSAETVPQPGPLRSLASALIGLAGFYGTAPAVDAFLETTPQWSLSKATVLLMSSGWAFGFGLVTLLLVHRRSQARAAGAPGHPLDPLALLAGLAALGLAGFGVFQIAAAGCFPITEACP